MMLATTVWPTAAQSTLQSWGLQITTIPEPAIGALGILAGAIIGLRAFLPPSPRRPRK
jgi:hypothetical protein